MAEIMGFIKMAVAEKNIVAIIVVVFLFCVASYILSYIMSFVFSMIVAVVRAKKSKTGFLKELKNIWS